jgi:cysteinyl-tRNA synthetase
MSKSLGNSLTIPAVLESYRGIDLRFYLVSAHYRSHVEFSFEALDEAAAAFRRIENFLDRAEAVLGERPEGAMLCAEFIEAMDDDLGTPAAIAAIHQVVTEGNKLLAGGASPALRGNLASVLAMLGVLGLDPGDPAWEGVGGSVDARLSAAVDALVAGLLEERAAARAEKDWGRADAIRDRIAAAGIVVEDTPDGPKWTLADGAGQGS